MYIALFYFQISSFQYFSTFVFFLFRREYRIFEIWKSFVCAQHLLSFRGFWNLRESIQVADWNGDTDLWKPHNKSPNYKHLDVVSIFSGAGVWRALRKDRDCSVEKETTKKEKGGKRVCVWARRNAALSRHDSKHLYNHVCSLICHFPM